MRSLIIQDEINADRFSVMQIFPTDNHTTVSSKVQSLCHSKRCVFAASLPPFVSCFSTPFFRGILFLNRKDQHVSKVTCKRITLREASSLPSLSTPRTVHIGGPFYFLVYSSQIIFKLKTRDQIDVCGFSCLFFFSYVK